MSINIDRAVFVLWEQRFAEFDEPGITLRLRFAAPEDGLLRVLRRVTLRVEEEFGPGPDRNGMVDERRSGAWRRCRRPTGCCCQSMRSPMISVVCWRRSRLGLKTRGSRGTLRCSSRPACWSHR
jgi:hypothetical protein